jgi:mediator of RNA polymerase II transcription subunit 10
VELLAKQNQYINGKMKAMNKFRNVLASQIKQAYPDLDQTVDGILDRTTMN